jgi:hypothetical protein
LDLELFNFFHKLLPTIQVMILSTLLHAFNFPIIEYHISII